MLIGLLPLPESHLKCKLGGKKVREQAFAVESACQIRQLIHVCVPSKMSMGKCSVGMYACLLYTSDAADE